MLNEVFGVLSGVCATTLKAGVGASVGLCGIVRWTSMKAQQGPMIMGQDAAFMKEEVKKKL